MKKTRIIAAALSVVTVFTLIAFASCSQKPSSDSGLTETGAKTGISPLTVHETEPISETKDSTQTGSPVETGNSVETEPETGVPSETQTEERVPLTPAQLSELVAETDSTFGGGISMNYETFNWEILDEAINNFNYENYSEARRIICDADNRIVEKFNNDTSDLSQITRKCESTCIDGNYAFAVLYYDPEGTLKYVNTHFYDLYRGKSLELSDALKAVKLTEEKLREKLSATGAQLREDSKIEGFVPYPYGIYDVFVSSGENGVDTYKLTIPEARSELFTCHA
ncbi:MAG: hypothetical protein VB118_12535, partial [Oscillospiraceae bacterium]|nr:hypothetical protein [Oscillospiraceae bacterium]